VKLLFEKLRPTVGFAHIAHLLLLAALPAIIFVLIRLDFTPLAFLVVLLSKWRMFAVKPRFWLSMLHANAVDLMVGFAIVTFMSNTDATIWQLIWAVLHGIWLMLIKPSSKLEYVALQAQIGMMLAFGALFIIGDGLDLIWLVLGSGMIAYGAARHFFVPFEERHSKLLASIWGFFAASLVWVLGHWLIYYVHGLVAQPAVILTVIGYGLGGLYYLDHTTRLSVALKRQITLLVLAITLVLILFSDWGDKIV
jgi:hypothetical protein